MSKCFFMYKNSIILHFIISIDLLIWNARDPRNLSRFDDTVPGSIKLAPKWKIFRGTVFLSQWFSAGGLRSKFQWVGCHKWFVLVGFDRYPCDQCVNEQNLMRKCCSLIFLIFSFWVTAGHDKMMSLEASWEPLI